MLIQQLVKTQTISILDKVLQNLHQPIHSGDCSNQHPQQAFTAQQLVKLYEQNGAIKQNQSQILLVLIKKYLELYSSRPQNQNHQTENKLIGLNIKSAKEMLQTIRTSILEQSSLKNDKNSDQITKNQVSTNKISQPDNKQNSILNNKRLQSQTHKKAEKQNQFITRNIDRIKRYATHSSQTTLPMQRSQLQQIKISHQISHKLFHLYKAIYPSQYKLVGTENFQIKEQYKSTLNYHKILQMFADANLKLEIQNKLSLLRIVKKFAFNPNFVTLEEWVKIYRAIINNLDVKQVALQRVMKVKLEQNKNPIIFIPSLAFKAKPQYRTRRIKTQTIMPESRFISLGNINPDQQPPKTSQQIIQYTSNNSAIRPMQSQSKMQQKSYNPNQYRSRHKKLLTDVSSVYIKSVKKDLKSQKMVGVANVNNMRDAEVSFPIGKDEGRIDNSYLNKAITSKKIGRITWQTLFEMKESAMYHNIVVPEFAKDSDDLSS